MRFSMIGILNSQTTKTLPQVLIDFCVTLGRVQRRPCRTSTFQLFVTLAVIATALLDPFQAAIRIGGFIGFVLVEAGVHASFAGGFPAATTATEMAVVRTHLTSSVVLPPNRTSSLRRLRPIISCRAPQYEPSPPLQHALWHGLCDPSQYERGPFRDVQHYGAWRLPRGGGRRA